MSYLRFCALTFMIVLPAVMRLADLGWNFAPIGAVALFAGATFRNRWLAFAVPLGAMFASDIALGWHRQNFSYYTFHTMMPVVYFCYAISVCLGFGIRRQWNRLDAEEAGSALAPGGRDAHPHRPGLVPRRMVPVAFGTLGGSLLFFVVTNFGDWVVYYSVLPQHADERRDRRGGAVRRIRNPLPPGRAGRSHRTAPRAVTRTRSRPRCPTTASSR